MHWKDKDLYYNKGFIFKVLEKVFLFSFSPSFIFLILYFERKGDNLYRIGLLLFSYHPFLYQEIALIFSQSCITPRPEDWDVSVSASVRDIKILSHLEINPSVEKLHKLSAWLWSQAGVRSATSWSNTCLHLSNPFYKMRIQGKAYICPHMQNFWVKPFFCFSFKPQNPNALCKLYTEIRWAISQYHLPQKDSKSCHILILIKIYLTPSRSPVWPRN